VSRSTTTKTETLEQSIARRDYAAHSPHDAVRYVDEQVAAAAAAAKAAEGGAVVILVAKFASTCPCCGTSIRVGSKVNWTKGSTIRTKVS
jgi:hypothetical protein